MENGTKIQIGLMAVIILLLGYLVFTGGFGGGSSDDAKKAARESLKTTPSITSDATKPTTPPAPTGPKTTMLMAEKEYDFGTIDQADGKVTHVFKFKNTGKEPLVISNAKGSCGCTVPEWPKEPIAVGESGEIKVEFDPKNKKGNQSKSVTITANTEPVNTILQIKANIEGDAPATTAQPITPKVQTAPAGK